MKECYNIREYFLDELQYRAVPTVFFLMNGYQLKGVLRHYDEDVLIVESGGRRQMVFRHAVSTVAPTENIEFPSEY